ncbi:MAG: hypothetical protein QM669_09595 [Siphonobacter sp.]
MISQAQAQGILTDHENYELSTQLLAGKLIPFWMRANQYGIIPKQASILQASFQISSDYQQASKTRSYLRSRPLDWGYGLQIVGNLGAKQQLLLPEAYLKARLGKAEFYMGKRKELFGLADSTLGTGPYAWSGNAMPVPKIQIGFPNWTPIGGGTIAFQAIIAHGWLDEQDAFVRKVNLHQKTVYLRIGKSAAFQAFFGINHQVQWGGYAPSLQTGGSLSVNPDKNLFFESDGHLPQDASAFWSIFKGQRTNQSHYNPYDAQEWVGNHLGSVDMAVQIQNNHQRLFIYRQQPFDMPSILHLANWQDGLTGISLTTNDSDYPDFCFRKLVFEWLYTKNQGRTGPLWGSGLTWTENYFNSRQYLQGWSYHHHTIGTPFISSVTDHASNQPSATMFSTLPFFTNANQLSVFHLGFEASVHQDWYWSGKISYTHSTGADQAEFKSHQTSLLLSLKRQIWFLRGSEIQATIAADLGTLYPTSAAFSIGIRKKWGFMDENISFDKKYRLHYRKRNKNSRF